MNAAAMNQFLAKSAYENGLEYMAGSMYPMARSMFIEATRLDPDNSVYWHFTGLMCWQIGQVCLAHQFFKKALSVNPEYMFAKKMMERAHARILERRNSVRIHQFS